MSRGYETGTPLNFVDDFGGIGDGVYDNVVEFAAAIAALPAQHRQGRKLLVPAGNYLTSGQWDLSGQNGCIVEGMANGETAGAAASAKIVYTGTAAQFINAQNSNGTVIKGLQILNSKAGFTGALIDGRNLAGSDTSFLRVEDCYLGGTGAGLGTATGIALDKCNISSVRRCNFAFCGIGITGKATNGSYANQITIADNHFVNSQTVHIKNAAEAWYLGHNVFENLRSGGAGAYTHDAGVFHKSLHFDCNWFGDVTVPGGAQITVGGSFSTVIDGGNYIGFNNGVTGVLVDANGMDTLVIEGNTFDGGTGKLIDFGASTGHVGVLIGPNRNSGSGAYVTGQSAGMVVVNGNTANPAFLPTVAVTTAYQVLVTDSVVFCQSGGGAYTVTLPTPVGVAGDVYVIKHTTGANLVTLATTAGQIDGAATYVGMAAANSSVTVVSDGVNWFTIASR